MLSHWHDIIPFPLISFQLVLFFHFLQLMMFCHTQFPTLLFSLKQRQPGKEIISFIAFFFIIFHHSRLYYFASFLISKIVGFIQHMLVVLYTCIHAKSQQIH